MNVLAPLLVVFVVVVVVVVVVLAVAVVFVFFVSFSLALLRRCFSRILVATILCVRACVLAC
jgi:hypothetical protein